MPRETPEPRESIAPEGRFVLDMPEPDGTPWCKDCFRNLDECPGHEDDPELLELGVALVKELGRMRLSVPKEIVRFINQIEDRIRKHHEGILP